MGFHLLIDLSLSRQCPQKGDKQKKVYRLEGTIPTEGKINIRSHLPLVWYPSLNFLPRTQRPPNPFLLVFLE